jgi:hypothetical protein
MLITLNKFVNRAQYIMFMHIIFAVYVSVSLALTPIAYVVSCYKKLKSLKKTHNFRQKFEDKLLFIPFGLVIMVLNLCNDSYIFWMSMFRKELKQIIIEKD